MRRFGPKGRLTAASAALLLSLFLLWLGSRRFATPPPPPENPPLAIPSDRPAPRPSRVPRTVKRNKGGPSSLEEPAPMVILEELVINQQRRKLGSSPDIDAALARLPVLEKCVQEPLEVVWIPSLDSHINMHVGILKRFKKSSDARKWLEMARPCAPAARMEIIKAYFLE